MHSQTRVFTGASWLEALMVAMRLRYNSTMAEWVVDSCLRTLDTFVEKHVVGRRVCGVKVGVCGG